MEHNLASPCCHQTRSDTGSNTETAARLCHAEGKCGPDVLSSKRQVAIVAALARPA